jgi:elongation factor G
MPEPVIFIAVEPHTDRDMHQLDETLQLLSSEEPTLHIYTDWYTDRVIIACSEEMGDSYLTNLVAGVLHEFKIEANISKPQAFYRETIRTGVRQEDRYIRQSGGGHSYGHVVIEIEPGEPGSGLKFISKLVSAPVLEHYSESIEQGIKETCASGILAGYPVTDLIVRLVDGSYHEYDSHEMAFKIAASSAITEAVKKAQPVLLEPLMKVEIEVPHDCWDEVIHLLDSLRRQIDRQERSGEIAKIIARVPRAEMFGFQTDLDRLSQSCSSFSMEFDRFDEVPQHLTEKVIMEHEQRKLQARKSWK